MITNIWLRLPLLLGLWLLVVVQMFAGPAISHYDGRHRTTVAYDCNSKPLLAHDTVLVLFLGEKEDGSCGDQLPFGKFAELVVARGGVAPIYCFAAGTNVATPEGERNIEDIKEGDLVLAYDFEQGKMVERPIKELVRRVTQHRYELTMADGEVKVTGGHPFWVESQQDWVYARDLRIGMTLRDVDGQLLPIQSIRFIKLKTPEATFNFEVEQNHNYFTGSSGSTVFVHNTDPFDIQFSRSPSEINASQTFSHGVWKGRTLGEAVAEAQRLGRLPPGQELNATRYGAAETLVAANNRTLWVAQQAGLRNVSVAGLENGGVAKTVMTHFGRKWWPILPSLNP